MSGGVDPLSHIVQLEKAQAAIGELLEMIDGLEEALRLTQTDLEAERTLGDVLHAALTRFDPDDFVHLQPGQTLAAAADRICYIAEDECLVVTAFTDAPFVYDRAMAAYREMRNG